MDAVLEIDLEPRRRPFAHHLIDPRRAIALCGLGIDRQVHANRHACVFQRQMRRLAFRMVGKAEGNVGQTVETQHPIGFGIGNRGEISGFAGGFGIGLAMFHRAQQRQAEQVVGPHINPAHRQRGHQPEPRPQRFDVAHPFQIATNRATAHRRLIARQLIARPPRRHRRHRRLCRRNPRQHGIVIALDARHIDQPGGTAQQRHAGGDHLGDRLPAALADRPGAVSHPFAAAQQVRHHRMMLEALKFHIGVKPRVLIIQMHDEPDINLIIVKVIDETATPGITTQRPAHRMGDSADAVLFGINLPQLFHPQPEFLRLMPGTKVVSFDDLLGQRPPDPFGQKDIFAQQLQPGFIFRPFGAIGQAAKLARHDAAHRPVIAMNQRRTGHAGEYFHPQSLGLNRQPAADIAHRHDVIAVVRHQGRHRPVRDAQRPRLSQHVEIVARYRHADRRTFRLPVRDQRIKPHRVQHRARQDMGANLRPLFQHHHRQTAVQLLQPDRSRQARRARPHDHHIILHLLACRARHGGPLPLLPIAPLWQGGCRGQSVAHTTACGNPPPRKQAAGWPLQSGRDWGLVGWLTKRRGNRGACCFLR